MRISCTLIIQIFAGLILAAAPQLASADAGATWQSCVAAATSPDDKVTACTAVIDARTETGNRLAAAYCNRGYGLTEKRELDRALADLDEAIKIDPAYACAYTNRGRVFAFKKDLDRAIKDYDEALRIDPAFALAYNNRGDAWVGKGDARRAMADFDTAIKIDPDLAIAHGN
ncbi:MAG: tetratricopeptide repeat protein, partial [Proteobacteria bacterium]|nr:tetratricopeptide repeat protein [Pseudomonadota bacterium]